MSARNVGVVCVETGERFDSLNEAARRAGVTAGAMFYATVNGSPCRGLRWVRLEPVQRRGTPSDTQRLLLAEICSRAGEDGRATASVRELARAVRASEETVRVALRSLRRAGMVESGPRFAPDGGQLGNWYRVTARGFRCDGDVAGGPRGHEWGI